MKQIVLFFSLIASTLLGTDYYVDKVNGNNGNPGTSTGSAKATIAAGVALLSAGDTLYIMGDGEVYAESVNNTSFSTTGTSWSSPITIAGYSNDVVTINPSTTARCFDFQSDSSPKTYIVISNLVLDGTGGTDEAAKVQGYNGYFKFSKLLIKDVYDSHGIQVSSGDRPAPSGCCNIIDQVTITNCGFAGGSPSQPNHAVYVKTDSNIIENCVFINNHSHGIHQFGNDNYGNIYRYNIIGRDNGISNDTGIGIYSGGTNNYVIGNIIYGLGFVPLRLDAPNNFALNNTFIHCAGGLRIGGSGNVVANNIVAYCGNGYSDSGIQTASSGYSSLVISNNLAFDCYGGNDNITSSYTGANNLFGDSYDANFVNTNITYGTLNVALTPGSDAIDSGVDLSGYFTVDSTNYVYGTDGQWDMGAIEVQSESPPDPLTGLTATAITSARIDLSWSDNDDDPQETSIRIERSATGGGAGFSEVDSVAADVTSYTDELLSPSTTYYYRIRARNGAGDSAYTTEANATTPAASVGTGNKRDGKIPGLGRGRGSWR